MAEYIGSELYNSIKTNTKEQLLNKRNWIGSEISEEYCKIIERRITTAST